ncbi:MAG: hypothetical protein WC783_03350 [Candidatus Paceibacterota bacterium]|jgi:protein-S-isoprenylcysteine O-methyltransferase Ste14
MFLEINKDQTSDALWNSRKYKAAIWLTKIVTVLIILGFYTKVILANYFKVDFADFPTLLSETSFVTLLTFVWGGYFIANVVEKVKTPTSNEPIEEAVDPEKEPELDK